MRKIGRGAVMLVAGLVAAPLAHGQRTTEQYVPIGQSPGASGKLTSIGEIAEADPGQRSLTISEPGAKRTLKITDKTRIYLDRSKLRKTNLKGSFADLQAGRRVEVKYDDPALKQGAEWIKVEITQP